MNILGISQILIFGFGYPISKQFMILDLDILYLSFMISRQYIYGMSMGYDSLAYEHIRDVLKRISRQIFASKMIVQCTLDRLRMSIWVCYSRERVIQAQILMG